MGFVSYHRSYYVLGKDILDWWYIWPMHGLCIYFPMMLIGVGLSWLWEPFLWLTIPAQGLLVVLVAHTLVFLAAACIQALLTQVQAFQASHPSSHSRWRVGVPAKYCITLALVPAGLAAPISVWGMLTLDDRIVLLGIYLWLLPVVPSLSLAGIVHLINQYTKSAPDD